MAYPLLLTVILVESGQQDTPLPELRCAPGITITPGAEENMITVIGNLKGGTGKSTVTFNLAVWLRAIGVDTKVIDLDPQYTLTDASQIRKEERLKPSLQVYSHFLNDEAGLRNSDETLIDVGTSNLRAFKHALTIADRVLIPVTPSQADVWSTQRFLKILQLIADGRPQELIAFINRADVNPAIRETKQTAEALMSLPDIRFLPQRLSERTAYRGCFSEGRAVFEIESSGRGGKEFQELASALFGYRNSASKDSGNNDKLGGLGPVEQDEPEEAPLELVSAWDKFVENLAALDPGPVVGGDGQEDADMEEEGDSLEEGKAKKKKTGKAGRKGKRDKKGKSKKRKGKKEQKRESDGKVKKSANKKKKDKKCAKKRRK